MAALICKAIDLMLFLYFLVYSMAVPLVDPQTVLPQNLFPELLVHIHDYLVTVFQNYLMVEKPRFYVALIWAVLLFPWPLALLNVYGMLTSKPWLKTTCLLYGTSMVTMMVPVFGEILGNPKTTFRSLILNSIFMAFGVLAFLRGLLLTSHSKSGKSSSTSGKGPRNKRD